MHKSIYFLLGSLLILSVGGYMLPETNEPVPTRILLQNVGGRVVFDHKNHFDSYSLDCAECHHEASNPEQQVLPCGSCHGAAFDEKFKTEHVSMTTDPLACATCHHVKFVKKDWGHDVHTEGYALECTACHHDTDIEDTPQNCANCHARAGQSPAESAKTNGSAATSEKSATLSFQDAVHARCKDCHEDKWDAGMKSCAECHDSAQSKDIIKAGGSMDDIKGALTDCSRCHDAEPAKLVPSRMSAFHTQCIGCHKEMSGPTDDCAQCHTK